MSQHDATHAVNGHLSNGRADSARTVDWSGYPALFQRVAPAAEPKPRLPRAVELTPEQVPAIGRSGGVRGAFLGFCQAALFSPSTSVRADRMTESFASIRALAAAEAFGFTRDEVRRLGCGLYTGPASVREDLRGVGFGAAEIDAARVACDDAGRPRTELAGCFVVPLTDEAGQLCDFLFLTVGETGAFSGYRFLEGPAKSDVAAFGLQTALAPAGRRSLVIVEDVLEALLLQIRGLSNVAAIGGAGEDLSPSRWEELARLGVASVTLAFRRDERHAASVRDALVGALRARTAPEIFTANPYPAGERSAADVLRRFGAEACGTALAARSLAFHDKDFGAQARVRPAVEPVPVRFEQAPQPVHVPAEPHYRTAFRKHLANLAGALPAQDRAAAQAAIEAFELAIAQGDYARAAWLIEGEEARRTPAQADWFWTTWAGGYAVPRHQRPTAASAPSPSVPSSSAAEILDRLAKSPEPGDVPSYLAGYAGREALSGIEWLIDDSPRGRLATLCERIADACDRRPGHAFVVACCEHTERQVLLALATHVAARFTQGRGLTVEEVRARLAGAEPADGYGDKPWLADEAADRLRVWSNRLTFVTCPPTPAGRTAVERTAEAVKSRGPIGGIYFDSLPAGAAADAGWSWLGELARRAGGPVVAAAPAAPSPAPAARPFLRTESAQAIVETLRNWLRREREVVA